MKNIIGFERIELINCPECECLFTIDSLKDIESWTINGKKKSYVLCPNCKSMCNKIMFIDSKECKKMHISL
jgi:hypothetical protein